MLLPQRALVQELGIRRNKISIQELGYIKKEYGISIQAIVMRALECEIIDSGFAGKFFGYLNLMNWRTEEPISYDGIEKSKRFDQLLYRALSEEQISTSKAAALKNMKLADFRLEFMAI
jgi:Zn-dependent peptidase ImmA (M78 family)